MIRITGNIEKLNSGNEIYREENSSVFTQSDKHGTQIDNARQTRV